MSRALLLALALAALGCNEGNELASSGFDLAQPGDGGGSAADGASDLGAPDLASRTCGQIVSCVVQCGVGNLTCDPMCIQGADPTAIAQAGALTLCAVQNCISFTDGGAGGGGMLGIFQCLIANCQMQVANCSGLFSIPM